MEEIVKHINDTHASYRAMGAGDAKNTDLFLDNEQYELFKDSGEQVTVRFNKENLQKAILFIASILPRKYDNSAVHKTISFSSIFVYDQLAFLDGFFTVDGVKVESKTQIWNARKDVMKANGEIDKRFYFNGLLEDVEYTNFKGERKSAKFTIRNYIAGGYSDLHIKKADNGIFDVWVTNTQEPYNDGKEKGLEIQDTQKDNTLQKIFYGAPGTGKSHTIKENTEKAEKEGRVFRTTFHPDSDYSTFVGCYKPGMKSRDRIYSAEELAVKLKEIKNSGVTYPCHKFAAQYWRSLKDLSVDAIKQILNACGFTESMNVEISKGVAIGQEYLNKEEDGKIIYTFTPQAFTNAYIKAWNTTEDVYLIIEEINRGNCAQIFGDLFQLLDRGDDGKSEYPIDADTDLGSYIAKELKSSTRTDFPDGVRDGKKLVVPSNLYIWATMNTSDQSLFPIDSAFKRRWDWKYLPIENAGKNWKIKVNGNEYDWYKFLEAINKEVLTLTHSEDKQLGYFFAKAKDGVIDAETLVNKVYFYLWTDVFKDYDYESQKAFRKPNSNDSIAFKNFFEELKNDEKVNEEVAERVLINLELEKLNKPVDLFG